MNESLREGTPLAPRCARRAPRSACVRVDAPLANGLALVRPTARGAVATLATSVAVLLVFATSVVAEVSLEARLPAAAAIAVRAIVDDAASRGLPIAPLTATALEGAARGAAPERIVAAVRSQAAALRAVRDVLDGGATEAEIVAGASLVRAGVTADSLIRLRTSRSGSLVIPMVVMADMMARGVPSATASGTIIAAMRRSVRDPDLLRLREHVAQDISAGASPREAAIVRAQALMMAAGNRPRPSSAPGPRLPGPSPP